MSTSVKPYDSTPPRALPQPDEHYMNLALSLAARAADLGEIPVGALVVWDDGRIVGEGYNTRETEQNALCHAECRAIEQACRTLGGWRLHRATLFVTLEPCPMCTGAAINARIHRVVYGAPDRNGGAMGGKVNLCETPGWYRPQITGGILEHECAQILQHFFQKLREGS